MRLAEGQGTLRGPILLLELWALLGPVQCSQGRPSWRYISSEVVIPRKQVDHGKSIQVPGWVSYSLKFNGQRYVIHMQLKKLFRSRYLPVISQDDQGALKTDYPYVPQDCYYLGYLEEIPYSLVTIDTCYGGINGIMKLDDLAYEIRPLKDSHRFEHIISQIVADENAMKLAYRLGTKEETDPLFSAANNSAAPRWSSKHFASHQSNIQGIPQCSLSVYRKINNFTNCVSYMVRFTSIIDSFFWGLHIRYNLYGLIIYNVKDPAPLNNYQVPGSPFHRYYSANIFSRIKHQSSFVLIEDGPVDYTFNPEYNSICKNSNLIMIGQLGRHYLLISSLATQHIARTIGISFDSDNCVCQRRTTCIMQKYPGLTDSFSNCSFHDVSRIQFHGTDCLFTIPGELLNKTLLKTRCGNRIVEAAEQCDCGSHKQCYSNPCCSIECKLIPGTVCDVGLCCVNCTYSRPGVLCRPVMNICDLPEYCTGTSSKCPADFYLQDGTPCTEDGYCYRGNCTDRDLHCKEIFGSEAINAADICYTINKRSDRFGHCRRLLESSEFIKCNDADLQCGRLQCSNVTHLPKLQEHVSFHQSFVSGVLCFGVDEHRSTETTDVGKVKNGSPCASGKFCDNTFCNGTLTDLQYDCVPKKCSYRGICNNLKNCHCHIGWSPPLCLHRGAGGSVNSGPPPRRIRSIKQNKEAVTYLRLVYGRIYILIFAFLIGVATNVRSIKTIRDTEPEEEEEEEEEEEANSEN